MYKNKYSRHLAFEKVLEQVCDVPQPLRKTLKTWLKRKIVDRDSSVRWTQRHPDHLKVTEAQCSLMLQAHDSGVSFRALERIFHLRCQSGNAAQRCCWRAEGIKGQSQRRSDAA